MSSANSAKLERVKRDKRTQKKKRFNLVRRTIYNTANNVNEKFFSAETERTDGKKIAKI